MPPSFACIGHARVRACTSAVTTVLPDRLQLMVPERRMARLHSENCVSTASRYRCACNHMAGSHMPHSLLAVEQETQLCTHGLH